LASTWKDPQLALPVKNLSDTQQIATINKRGGFCVKLLGSVSTITVAENGLLLRAGRTARLLVHA